VIERNAGSSVLSRNAAHAPSVPFPGRYGNPTACAGPECHLLKEPVKTWYMLVCNRAYCGQIGYKRIDPTIPPERYVNNCYWLKDYNIQYFIGAARAPYSLEWYADTKCNKLLYRAKSLSPKGVGKIYQKTPAPKSFMVKYKGDKGIYPRVAFCGQKDYSRTILFKEQALQTDRVCEKVHKICLGTKNRGFECPKDCFSTQSAGGPGDTYTYRRCKITNPTLQAWFNKECAAPGSGYYCLRDVLDWGDGSGPDTEKALCESPRRDYDNGPRL
jgi:hypothetical protein